MKTPHRYITLEVKADPLTKIKTALRYNLEVKADPFILDLVMRNVTPETEAQAVQRREKEAQFRQELELQQKRLQYMFSK
jgi:hypothetical protein